MPISFDPNQLRGQPSNAGSWVANPNGAPEKPLSDGVVTTFNDDEFGKIRIVRDEYDADTFQAQGDDGIVTFRADANSTPEQLLKEGLDFYSNDDLRERGHGLDNLDEHEQLRLTNSYLEAALWSSTGEDEEPLDDEHDLTDVSDATLEAARSDLDGFLKANHGLITRAINNPDYGGMEQVGHDFWLTRNGHGAGFWDRGLGELGDELTKNTKPFGGVDLYVGDDGKIYGA